MSIYLYGGGGHAKVIADVLSRQNRWVAGFVVDSAAEVGVSIHGVPVLPSTHLSNIDPQNSQWIVAIGNNKVRQAIAQKLAAQGYTFTIAIHPSAQISQRATIGPGTVVMPNATINVDATIGQHAIINTGTVIDHDCHIADYAHIAPNCGLCGSVRVGTGSLLGVGTQVIPGKTIGEWSVCGAGSVLVKDVPARCLAYGVPTAPQRFFEGPSKPAQASYSVDKISQ